MPHTLRIGIEIRPADPFWVQVREVLWRRTQLLDVELVEITIEFPRSPNEQAQVVEDLLVQDLDALICNTYPPSLIRAILERNIPIIYVSEIAFEHPRFTSRVGLYDAAQMLGTYLCAQLPAGRSILIVGGLLEGDDYGRSRIAGFLDALPLGRYSIVHVPTSWLPEEAQQQLAAHFVEQQPVHFNAIYGLSDSLALIARDTCRTHGAIDSETLILGINGDPLAIAAIAEGSMTATIETDVEDIASQAINLAYRAAQHELLPAHFRNQQRLVHAETVIEVAMHKLISLAMLPTRLVGVNRRIEAQRMTQFETSYAIDQQVAQILDQHKLSLAVTGLIRDNYGFDQAQFLSWDATWGQLATTNGTERESAPPHSRGPLAYALQHNQIVFIPDTSASHRFAPDPQWHTMRARVIVPVHFAGQIIGLLDLHRKQAAHHTREELDGLQLLADQLGVAMRNAELYEQALAARAAAEKADSLKTRLLANVSHELRTPLNIILGYSRTALDELRSAGGADTGLSQDLAQIYQSGEYLMRLINDLLDLSRAEIDELELLTEPMNTHAFLMDVFRSSADSLQQGAAVGWVLNLPTELPMIEADPVRLRQILLNLLYNAHKFTERGTIELGAMVEQGRLHVWVADTGVGIPANMREAIFEPFVSGGSGPRRREGIGLGLSITRRLVALHAGHMQVASEVGRGSTFHIYLPLPVAATEHVPQKSLLLIGVDGVVPEHMQELARQRGLIVQQVRSSADLDLLLMQRQPALLAWQMIGSSDASRQLIEQIRTRPQIRQLPMFLFHAEQDTTIEIGSGAVGLLLKPLNEGALLNSLGDLDPQATNGSILIVEDDPQTRALHRRLITERFPTYTIVEAGDGRAALALIGQHTPSLIVLDLVLPEVDGFAVLAALRANMHTSSVPVLVLSGHSIGADDIRRLGMARAVFQSKSILTHDELAEALQRALEHRDVLPAHTSTIVKAAIAFIQEHYAEPLSRQAIAEQLGVSKDYLGRIVQQELGLSPWEYLIRYRVMRAKELLLTSSSSVGEIAAQVGFETATYFSHIFSREVGCSPRAFRTAGRDSTRIERDS